MTKKIQCIFIVLLCVLIKITITIIKNSIIKLKQQENLGRKQFNIFKLILTNYITIVISSTIINLVNQYSYYIPASLVIILNYLHTYAKITISLIRLISMMVLTDQNINYIKIIINNMLNTINNYKLYNYYSIHFTIT